MTEGLVLSAITMGLVFHASMAESSIQNVTDPSLHSALLYSAQLVIVFFALPILPTA